MSDDAPVTIRFIGAPVELMQSVRLHLEALTREFQLIEFGDDDTTSPPARLVELTSRLRDEYDRFDFATSRHGLSEAVDRGTDSVDLELVVPPDAGAAARLFLHSMDESDAWCERGELLTLASLHEQRVLRRWFFGEIERQGAGEPAQAWAEYVEASADTAS